MLRLRIPLPAETRSSVESDPCRAGAVAPVHAAPRLVCFEAIRGLAALMVVVSHLLVGFWPALIFRDGPGWLAAPAWLRDLIGSPVSKLWDGGLAVTIFFVLSGFVLSVNFFQTRSARPLVSSAVRRYPRLMFPVAASVLLTYMLMKAGAICNGTAVRFMHASQGITYDPQCKMSESYQWLLQWYNFTPNFRDALRQGTWGAFTGAATYNLVLWTMPIELMGSFLVYAFLAVFGNRRCRWLLYVACGTFLYIRESSMPLLGYYALLDFILGMALCDLWLRNQRTWHKSLSLPVALVLVVLAFYKAHLHTVTALLIIGSTAASPALQRYLSGRWLAMLGRLSFGIYLVHMMIFGSLGCGTYLFVCRNLGWQHTTGALSAAMVTVLATFAAAWAFYHVVDRPTVALTHRLDFWLFGVRREQKALAPAILPRAPDAHAA